MGRDLLWLPSDATTTLLFILLPTFGDGDEGTDQTCLQVQWPRLCSILDQREMLVYHSKNISLDSVIHWWWLYLNQWVLSCYEKVDLFVSHSVKRWSNCNYSNSLLIKMLGNEYSMHSLSLLSVLLSWCCLMFLYVQYSTEWYLLWAYSYYSHHQHEQS